MSDLRALFADGVFVSLTAAANTWSQLYVYNTNTDSVNNGGRCCLWTVPANVGWARFEVWGGGGDGGGACCCQQPSQGGGSGTYARKTIQVVPGQTYTICAGGSGCCSQASSGTSGFPSYACNATATYPLALCASGGKGGESCCFAAIGGNYSCATVICGCSCGHDFALCGLTGSAHQSWCGFDAWQYAPQGTYIGAGTKVGSTHCGEFWMGCGLIGGSTFPGGGGGTAISYGGCCWGGWGSGGMVLITYK